MTLAARSFPPDAAVSPDDTNRKASEKSLGKVFPHAQHREILQRSQDPLRFRVLFPERWSRFLRQHHASVEEVAVFYDVRFRTATNWWEGIHRPTGDKVAQAALTFPESFRDHMEREA